MSTVMTYRDFYSKRGVPMTEKFYKELIQKASSYNSGLSSERKMRLPFIDSQTGVAQNHSSLWHPYRSRGNGERGGQVYSYPAKRWKKKKRSFPLPEIRLTKLSDLETGESDMHQISAVENPAVLTKEDSKDHYEEGGYKEPYQYTYYDDWDNLSEPPDAGEIDARHSDSSDFEESYVKKRKKKTTKGKGGRGKKKDSDGHTGSRHLDDSEKPYACELCGARYKTRPGLSYHVTHSHNNPKKKEAPHHPHQPPPREPQRERERDPPPLLQVQDTLVYDEDSGDVPRLEILGSKTRSTSGRVAAAAAAVSGSSNVSSQNEISKYCDFCLGDTIENKKTGQKEELVSCADCGRSGHPTCLQFTANMIISVKKYPWQCIECKSCGLCGTSDNDDQLLFCDDCDRGYHMYCLKPPLSDPPEGSWSCHLCIEEFYGGKKPDEMETTTTEL